MYPSVKKALPFSQVFWDATGRLWQQGKLHGKYAGLFVSTGGLGGGQESTAIAALSALSHHGIIFVPFGYAPAFAQLTNLAEVHGGTYFALLLYRVRFFISYVLAGSPWGAGTFADADGSRQPSALELEIAEIQGKTFYQTVAKAHK